MSHVDEGTLHAYLDGELPSTERAALEAHLAQCASCRATLTEERALLERASALLGSAGPAERATPPFDQIRRTGRSPWQIRTPVAWAASIALALGLGYYLRNPSTRTVPPAPAQNVVIADDRAVAAAPAAASEERAATPARPQQKSRQSAPPADALASNRDSARGVESGSSGVVALTPRVQLRNDAPRPAAVARQREADSLVANEAVIASDTRSALVPRGLVATEWPVISRGVAASLLGARPVGLPGLATRKIRRSPGADGTIVVEQALDSSTVIQIFQRPADVSARADTRLMEAPADRLARFVGRLRVEIAGPLSPDSLNRLLEQVEALP